MVAMLLLPRLARRGWACDPQTQEKWALDCSLGGASDLSRALCARHQAGLWGRLGCSALRCCPLSLCLVFTLRAAWSSA